MSSLDCKHKPLLEIGAPPDTFVVLYCLLHIELHGFNSSIGSRFHFLVPGINSIFTYGMGPFQATRASCLITLFIMFIKACVS